jgi:iron complex transport system substrate-binding protein
VSDLAKAGVAVHLFNQRDLAGIFAMIRTVGALIGEGDKAEALARTLEERVATVARETGEAMRRPRVYFEEWNDPMISAIGWVSELIEVAGGTDVFAHLRAAPGARERIVASEAVIAARPDVILASWCGKKVVPRQIMERPGWSSVPAVAHNRIVEIKSTLILQPGPAALTDGLDSIRAALR